MSRFAILARIDTSKKEALQRLRIEHYRYLLAHREALVFGGPTRVPESGLPETMIIVVEVSALSDAVAFMAREPYNASGCFTEVVVRPWSQVVPELEAGALARMAGNSVGPA